ncbi:MAG TPA: GH1 family beta-glucosidase [Acidimicrobiia bacterium]|nr:GH1 family beta-glucosidase [Acidimicrobiia bacterium]
MTTRRQFPADFRWGVAAAAYQIEGAVNEDGRGPSIWDTFSHTPGRTHGGDTGDVAADHYHRFEEDVTLMAGLGVNAYRFSISWSRLLPDGFGDVNPAGVEFYRRLCERLLETGITPVATLYHWDLPQALQDLGGWLDVRSATWFAEYSTVAKERLGDLVTVWSTLNEPWCSAFLGHSSGEHAPGLTDPGSGLVAAHNLMLAHHRGIAALRATATRPEDELGVVLNLIPAWPATDSEADRRAASAVDLVHNRLFADAAFHGRYPDGVLELHERYQVADVIDVDELAGVRADIDYLGVNYYNINHIAHAPGAPALAAWPGADEAVIATPPGHLTEMGWGVEPEGLSWMLRRIVKEYPAIPIMICENGAAYPDVVGPDGIVDDPLRIAYLEAHIEATADAIDAGVEVTGYFVWSFCDNFEWSLGYDKRFGLIRVDYETLDRAVKASGHWYRTFLAS